MQNDIYTVIVRSNAKSHEDIKISVATTKQYAVQIISMQQWAFQHSTTYKTLGAEIVSQEGRREFFWMIAKEPRK